MQIAFALFNGMTVGMAIFLVASGITLIFGMLKILNISHGSFFMLGAYVAFSIVGTSPESTWLLIFGALVAGVSLALLGLLINKLIFTRLRGAGEAYSLIATFALLMVVNGVVKLIWGVNYHSVYAPDELAGAFMYNGFFAPAFSIFIIALGLGTFLLLQYIIHSTSQGKVIRAISHDAWMAGLVGINTPRVYAVVIMAAFFLAGAAGGLLLPNQSVSPQLFEPYLLQSFVVVIVGGLGNIRGAFIASIMLGMVEGLNFLLLPSLPGLLVYLVLVGFLLWRPQGLFWQPGAQTAEQKDTLHSGGSVPATTPVALTPAKLALGLGLIAAILAVPYWANQGLVFIVGIVLIEAVLALSWNLLFGYIGLATFGHAAFFALGAYFVGYLLVIGSTIPFLLILVLAFVFGGAASWIIGRIAINRASGIALGILTLSLGEILRKVINYTPQLGSDDGLSGIPRPSIDLYFFTIDLGSEHAYYWFLCAICGLAVLALWILTVSSQGRAFVTIRQDSIRAEFLGIDVKRYRLRAFVISGAFAALAGALYAPWTQIITPDSASYLKSTQPMLNTLLGGSGFFLGPVVGSAVFAAISYGTRTLVGLSELVSGVILLLVVLAAPSGIMGTVSNLGTLLSPKPQKKKTPAVSVSPTSIGNSDHD